MAPVHSALAARRLDPYDDSCPCGVDEPCGGYPPLALVPAYRPTRAPRRGRSADRGLAPVAVLHAPDPQSIAAPVRLTHRGVLVLGAVVAALAVALVLGAWLSAPRPAASPAAPASVTVRAGDTLWSIATRVAPQRAPRAEIAVLERLNGLHGVALSPGQVLRTR